MYTLALKRSFTAEHRLAAEPGQQADIHAHEYGVTVELEGNELDRQGYLYDIVELGQHVDAVALRFSGKLLNRLPEFEGLNPSMENLARLFCDYLAATVPAGAITAMTVRIAEDAHGSAAYRREK